MPREGNDPRRRIGAADRLDERARQKLAERLVYVGSAHHKTRPGDYGFHPPVNPRPAKSICDGRRVILLEEAQALFRSGILRGMFSDRDLPAGQVPKYVWSVDAVGEVYEAKISPGTLEYKGYRLEEEDDMRRLVAREWAKR